MKIIFFIFGIITFCGVGIYGQPPNPQPPKGEMRQPRGMRPDANDTGQPGPPHGGWVRAIDTNQNGNIESEEFQAAADRTFAELDKNGDGVIQASEIQPPAQNRGPGPREIGDAKHLLPPFFFLDGFRGQQSATRADFDRVTRAVFAQLDKNGDGVIDASEARQMPPPAGRPGPPPPPPNAEFVGAEMRFGDKVVTGQPFSAETLITDTRRLYDGTTATQENKGTLFRDGTGRTRREQTLHMVGGVNLVGADNKPQQMVFINDPATNMQTFLDQQSKMARQGRLEMRPAPEPPRPADAKTESLGTKTIEGIKVDGTRTTFEIPAGQLGNDKPIQVVDERWFSPELQIVVMSSHIDPVAGEHVFKLVNIRRGEPSTDLFAVPSGYKMESRSGRPQGN